MFVSYLLFVNKDHIASSSLFLNMCCITFVLFDIFLYTLSSPASLCVSLRLSASPCVSLRLPASLCVPCASLALPYFSPLHSLFYSSLHSHHAGLASQTQGTRATQGMQETQRDARDAGERRKTQEDASDAGSAGGRRRTQEDAGRRRETQGTW